MAKKKYLSNDGLLYVWQKITNTFVKKDGSKVLSDNNYTTNEKTKLSGIEAGATKTIVDSTIDAASTNPVQNKAVSEALLNKVDKVTGKGLSTNDLTNALKSTYDETVETVKTLTATGGEPNKVNDVKVNGTSVVSSKVANITVPTKTSDLTNDSNFITDVSDKADKATTLSGYGITDAKIIGQEITLGSKSLEVPTDVNQLANGAGYITGISSNDVTDALGFTPYNATNPNEYQTANQVNTIVSGKGYQTAAQVESAITAKGYQTAAQVSEIVGEAVADIQGISYVVVTSLPTVGEAGTIYLISNGGSNPNIYDEYIWTNGKFEKIGTTDVDLSGYVQETDLEEITNAEIDEIVSTGIDISGGGAGI